MDIFKITNTQNGKVFVGLAKYYESRQKFMLIKLKNGSCPFPELQSDFTKHGKESFVFELVQTVTGSITENRQIKQEYITSKFNSSKQCYNIED